MLSRGILRNLLKLECEQFYVVSLQAVFPAQSVMSLRPDNLILDGWEPIVTTVVAPNPCA